MIYYVNQYHIKNAKTINICKRINVSTSALISTLIIKQCNAKTNVRKAHSKLLIRKNALKIVKLKTWLSKINNVSENALKIDFWTRINANYVIVLVVHAVELRRITAWIANKTTFLLMIINARNNATKGIMQLNKARNAKVLKSASIIFIFLFFFKNVTLVVKLVKILQIIAFSALVIFNISLLRFYFLLLNYLHIIQSSNGSKYCLVYC